jgi:hypothetical protein
MVMRSSFFCAALSQPSFLAALYAAVQRHERHVDPLGRLPKPLETDGKRAAKKDGKLVTCCVLRGTLY